MHNAFDKLYILTREMTECSLQTSQASTAADKTSASCSMSLVQSRCKLYFVQQHLPIRFGRETSNEFSVIKLQKNVFLLMPAAKLYKSLLTHCVAQLRLHQRQLRKAAVIRSKCMEGWSQLWHTIRTGFVAMLWTAVISDWHSRHWHDCSALGFHTLQSFASTQPSPILWKLIGFASISRLALAPVRAFPCVISGWLDYPTHVSLIAYMQPTLLYI